jgi:Tol biopolymer transport system component
MRFASRRSRWSWAFPALMATVILAAPDAPLFAASPVSREPQAVPRITYYSFRTGNAEIYLMDPDGANQTKLTNHSAADLSPAISPDGREIVFESTRYGNQELVLMNSDGSGLHRLTTTAAIEFCAAWSPDGTQIVFSRASGNGCTIHVINADGTNERQLTTGPYCDAIPDWSPDGLSILFHSDRDGHYEIYVMDADGTDQRRLTNGAGDKVGPKWSPDGTRIVYASANFTVNRASIHIMNADGAADSARTDGSFNDEAPDWSEDGSRIVFNSNRSAGSEIYSIDLGGNDLQRLTWDQGDSRGPNWGSVQAPSGLEEPAAGDDGRCFTLDFANPVRRGTPIRLTLDREARTSLHVFGSDGRCVRTLLRQSLGAGAHSFVWDGNDDAGRALPSAAYYFRLLTDRASRTATFIYVR